jgi:hypothetical protein
MNSTDLKQSSECPDAEELVEYYRYRLPEPRMLAVENHFGACELCVEQRRAVFEVLVALDCWTPESYGEAVRREALLAGLARAEAMEQEGSEWRTRLNVWRKQAARAADGAIELIVSASGARILTETLHGLVAARGFRFEPVAAVRGPSRPDDAGEGTEVLSVEQPGIRVSAHDGNRFTVTLETWPADRMNPGILVIDNNGEQPPLRLDLTLRADGVWETEFARERGEFMLLFAPTERKP